MEHRKASLSSGMPFPALLLCPVYTPVSPLSLNVAEKMEGQLGYLDEKESGMQKPKKPQEIQV